MVNNQIYLKGLDTWTFQAESDEPTRVAIRFARWPKSGFNTVPPEGAETFEVALDHFERVYPSTSNASDFVMGRLGHELVGSVFAVDDIVALELCSSGLTPGPGMLRYRLNRDR